VKTYLALTILFLSSVLIVVGLTPWAAEGGQATFQDGSYVGYSDANDKGYAMATVTIAEDQIVAVELTEFTGYGAEKDWDTYPYEPSVKAREELAGEFVAKNSADVDTYTGATSSSEKYRQAVARALEKALVEPASDNTYFDGTFLGQTEPNEKGQRAVALVTIENDRIVDVVLEQTIDESNEFKGEDYQYGPFHMAREEMARRFIAANSTDVDTFTGATGSSTAWMAAVEKALEHARR
jgi:uncharacterized protein with FMN-binding domain